MKTLLFSYFLFKLSCCKISKLLLREGYLEKSSWKLAIQLSWYITNWHVFRMRRWQPASRVYLHHLRTEDPRLDQVGIFELLYDYFGSLFYSDPHWTASKMSATPYFDCIFLKVCLEDSHFPENIRNKALLKKDDKTLEKSRSWEAFKQLACVVGSLMPNDC